MYFAIIANDNYPEETYTSNIYFVKPTLTQLYDKFGEPEDSRSSYYKWTILLKKITNFKEVSHVSSIQYSEDGWFADDYVVGGDGYLYEEHKQKLTRKEKERKLCGN